jgi:hypothetical protein
MRELRYQLETFDFNTTLNHLKQAHLNYHLYLCWLPLQKASQAGSSSVSICIRNRHVRSLILAF